MYDPLHIDKDKFPVFNKVMSIAFKCPKTQGNPKECPLYEFRKDSLRGRFEKVSEMPVEKLLDLVHIHNKCSKNE